MARIRTIKPEFPQSESMGRVSREARLCFIMLWTIADDAGRLRGNSRMLASLLFPYDDDAKEHIDTWLTQLSNEGCVIRYEVDGTSYLQVCNWLEHQKIDKPSASKIPSPNPTVANPREPSRILPVGEEGNGVDLGVDQEQGTGDAPPKSDQKKNIGTPAGSVCARLKAECRIIDVNPQHQKLIALLEAGLTADEIVAAGIDSKIKTFAYVLAAAEGRRRDAANVTPLPAARAAKNAPAPENFDQRQYVGGAI